MTRWQRPRRSGTTTRTAWSWWVASTATAAQRRQSLRRPSPWRRERGEASTAAVAAAEQQWQRQRPSQQAGWAHRRCPHDHFTLLLYHQQQRRASLSSIDRNALRGAASSEFNQWVDDPSPAAGQQGRLAAAATCRPARKATSSSCTARGHRGGGQCRTLLCLLCMKKASMLVLGPCEAMQAAITPASAGGPHLFGPR